MFEDRGQQFHQIIQIKLKSDEALDHRSSSLILPFIHSLCSSWFFRSCLQRKINSAEDLYWNIKCLHFTDTAIVAIFTRDSIEGREDLMREASLGRSNMERSGTHKINFYNVDKICNSLVCSLDCNYFAMEDYFCYVFSLYFWKNCIALTIGWREDN